MFLNFLFGFHIVKIVNVDCLYRVYTVFWCSRTWRQADEEGPVADALLDDFETEQGAWRRVQTSAQNDIGWYVLKNWLHA